MVYKAVDQLRQVADVHAEREPLSRAARLERWAELLEREPARLRSLGEIEFKTPEERRVLRVNGSPLTVAFSDPVLRADGLSSDMLGDATSYFGLSDRQVHRLLCSCMNGSSIAGDLAARRIRSFAKPTSGLQPLAWVGGAAAAIAATPILLRLFA
jgi:hypothetical protein